MSVLYMMIGVPGSGKSTIANEIGRVLGIPVVSSDSVRKELTGSEEDFSKDNEVWRSVIPNRLRNALRNGDVVFDATNLRVRDRNKTRRSIGVEHECHAVYVDVPLETCIERQKNRERKVPSEGIEEMYKEMVPPTTNERFENVYVVKDAKECVELLSKLNSERDDLE